MGSRVHLLMAVASHDGRNDGERRPVDDLGGLARLRTGAAAFRVLLSLVHWKNTGGRNGNWKLFLNQTPGFVRTDGQKIPFFYSGDLKTDISTHLPILTIRAV
jgi:hypothetical protein